MNHKLSAYGLDESHLKTIEKNGWQEFVAGRITAQHKDRYEVITEAGPGWAEITGNLRNSAETPEDFPTVGDWVMMLAFDDNHLIQHIMPRKTILERQAVGHDGIPQLIASNIDYALIVQSCDENFSPNRLERYLSVVHAGNITPIIVLNKGDLISEYQKDEYHFELMDRIDPDNYIHFTSTVTGTGISELKQLIQPGETYCLLGSSGVGKSSLLNAIMGKKIQLTDEISFSTNKGKHTTTTRQMTLVESGGVMIDTPGMRELGVMDSQESMERTFKRIYELGRYCRFNDCTHIIEDGCAVLEALDNGELEEEMLKNYHKMRREAQHYETSAAEKRQTDKSLGKTYKAIQALKRKNKGK